MLLGTRAELEEQGSRLRLNRSVLDQAILEAASNQKDMTPLAYLLGCWKRVMKAFRGLRGPSRDDPKYAILQETKRLCMSYCIFAATLPEMFGYARSRMSPWSDHDSADAFDSLDAQTSNPLITHLLTDPEDDRGICHDFLAEVVRRFDEDDSIREALVEAAEEISRRLADMTMNDDYKPYIVVREPRHPEQMGKTRPKMLMVMMMMMGSRPCVISFTILRWRMPSLGVLCSFVTGSPRARSSTIPSSGPSSESHHSKDPSR